MASSKLGRLRQWAEEKISTKEKPVVNEELRELERDIELRKDGIQRLILASQKYHHALSKKKTCAALEDAHAHAQGEKMLPIDILGMVMILHGEEFGDESPFGTALVKLGRAHCKVATLQEAYALTFKDTFLVSMERFRDEIKEYEVLKKKLESRRIALEAATAKFDKLQHSKKEKDRREAEDELERTKQRYEETAEDIRAHMHAIQENEHAQFRELRALLDLETNFVQGYLEVLRDVRGDLHVGAGAGEGEGEGQKRSDSRRSHLSSSVALSSKDKDKEKDKLAKSSSVPSSIPSTPLLKAQAQLQAQLEAQARAVAGLPPSSSREHEETANRLGLIADTSTTSVSVSVDSFEDEGGDREGDYEDDEEGEREGGYATPSRTKRKIFRSRSRRGSSGSRKDKDNNKDVKEKDKTPSSSRPASRLSFSRRRTGSSANTATPAAVVEIDAAAPGAGEEKEKGNEKKKEEKSRRMSLGAWVSGKTSSSTKEKDKDSSPVPASASTPASASASTGSLGRGKRRKSRDREAFAVLDDEDDDDLDLQASRTSLDSAGAGNLRKSDSFKGLARRRSKSKTRASKAQVEANPAARSSPSLSHSHSGSSLSMTSTFSSASASASFEDPSLSTSVASEGTASGASTPTKSSKSKSKILMPPSLQDRRKVVRVLYDFDATGADELSLRRGEEVVVIREVVDEWWFGEVLGSEAGGKGEEDVFGSSEDGHESSSASADGSISATGKGRVKRRGLFPKSYTQVVGSLPASAVAGSLTEGATLGAFGVSGSGPGTPGGDATAGAGVTTPEPPAAAASAGGKPKNPRRGSSGQSGSISSRGPAGFIASLFGGGGSSSSSPKVEAPPAPSVNGRGSEDLQDSDAEHAHGHGQDVDHPEHDHDAYLPSDADHDDDLHLRNPTAQPMHITLRSPVYFGRFDPVGVGRANEVDTASFTDQDSLAEAETSEDDTFGFKQQMREIEEREKAAKAFLEGRGLGKGNERGKWNVGESGDDSEQDGASFHSGSSASLVRVRPGVGGEGTAQGQGKGSEEDAGWEVVPPASNAKGVERPLVARTAPTTPRRNTLKGSEQLLPPPSVNLGMGRSLSDNPAMHSSVSSSVASSASTAASTASNGLLTPSTLPLSSSLSASTASMSSAASASSTGTGASATPRKIPPPPPPRRTASHTPGSNVPPAIPVRPAGYVHRPVGSLGQSQSLTPSPNPNLDALNAPGLGGGGAGVGYDRSPFESTIELGVEVGGEGVGGEGGGGAPEEGKPREVSSNPFRVQGL